MPLHKTPDGLPPGYQAGKHPGHWDQHHTMSPGGGPGDFTPYAPPGYAEETVTPLGELLERLGELLDVPGPDHAQALTQRGQHAQRDLEAE